jgi:hypothetical protein
MTNEQEQERPTKESANFRRSVRPAPTCEDCEACIISHDGQWWYADCDKLYVGDARERIAYAINRMLLDNLLKDGACDLHEYAV